MEFAQEAIATLHDFGDADPSIATDRVAVVVPLMGDDLGRPGVWHTFERISRLDPAEVIVPMRGDPSSRLALERQLDRLDLRVHVLWCNGPGISGMLEQAGIDAAGGKGLDVWLALGVAAADHDRIVVHDADSTSYSQVQVTRLAWPLEHQFDFVKGYYARIEHARLYGRLTRLLWTPLLSATPSEGRADLLEYLKAFRYGLAGECAMTGGLAPRLRLDPGWGLEVGILGEMFRLAGPSGTAQVDLGRHQHDHRPLEGAHGLEQMAGEVAAALFAVIRDCGAPVDRRRIGDRYETVANAFIDRYAADSAFNDFHYDSHDEREQVTRYRAALTREAIPDRLPPFADTSLHAEDLRAVSGDIETPRAGEP